MSLAIWDHTVSPATDTRTPASKGCIRFTYPERIEGWVDLGGWLHTEMVYPSTNGHPGVEYTLIKTDALPLGLSQATTRLVTGRRRDHITPVLRQLHWLPVRQRVDFKLALLVYKALHDATAASCRRLPACPSRRMSPAPIGRHRHVLCSTDNTRLGDRSFAAAGPRLWNSLPARIRQSDNDIGEFRWQLKSFLFNWHRGA